MTVTKKEKTVEQVRGERSRLDKLKPLLIVPSMVFEGVFFLLRSSNAFQLAWLRRDENEH